MNRLSGLIAMVAIAVSFGGCGTNQAQTTDKGTDTPTAEQPVQTTEMRAEEILNTMSLEEKVGQMFFARYPDDETAAADAKSLNLGGYILFGKDFEEKNAEEVRKMISDCNTAKIPMLIGVDEEGGLVNRVSRNPELRAERFKSPQQLYSEGGFELIKNDTAEKSELLKSLGINTNLAPVCDVSVDKNAFIHDRTFGADADSTSEYVKTVVSEMENHGMLSVLKHFPGYGDNGDTHTDVITDTRAFEVFAENDFKPFKAGIDSGADIILVSHNIVTSMDENYPASLSPKVNEILRNNLGFDGVVMTDDLVMGALNEYGTAAVLAVQAGNDLLCSTDYKTQTAQVLEAVKNGEISEERINESVKRILIMKIENGLVE